MFAGRAVGTRAVLAGAFVAGAFLSQSIVTGTIAPRAVPPGAVAAVITGRGVGRFASGALPFGDGTGGCGFVRRGSAAAIAGGRPFFPCFTRCGVAWPVAGEMDLGQRGVMRFAGTAGLFFRGGTAAGAVGLIVTGLSAGGGGSGGGGGIGRACQLAQAALHLFNQSADHCYSWMCRGCGRG